MAAFADREDNRLLWVVVGALIAVLIGFALLTYVGSLVSAIFLYYATRPIHRRIDRHVDHSDLAVTVTVFVVVLPMAFVAGYALFLIAQELDRVLSGGALEAVRPYAQPYLRLARAGQLQQLQEAITGASGGGGSTLRTVMENALGSVASAAAIAFSFVAQVFLLTVFLFYLLRDGHSIREWFYRSIDYDDRIVEFVDAVDEELEIVFFNNLVLVVLTAIQAAVIYLAMNLLVPGGTIVGTPVLLGTLVGIGMIIPIVGMKIVYVPYAAYLALVAATTGTPTWHPIVFLAVSAVVVDTIPDIFIRTYLSARGSLHMGLVLLGYVLGTMAFGWYGLFLGPIIVVVTYQFAHTVFPRLATSYLEE
ncbi:AI-2E family transporter [Halomontanus rarus]|uniref:AI-2E family transporter n=1 Tax=Halomontanus rarus TaxID=3034020 RepID=UPI001A98FCE9